MSEDYFTTLYKEQREKLIKENECLKRDLKEARDTIDNIKMISFFGIPFLIMIFIVLFYGAFLS